MSQQQLSIDIETTGLRGHVKILSIGAVLFDSTGVGLDTFYERIDPGLWPEAFKDDPDTLDWWKRQDAAAMDEAFGGIETPEVALAKLSIWVRTRSVDGVWSRGSLDLPVIDNAIKAFGLLAPWSYRQHRDQRTLLHLAGVEPRKNTSWHNALADAQCQAEDAVQALDILGVRL